MYSTGLFLTVETVLAFGVLLLSKLLLRQKEKYVSSQHKAESSYFIIPKVIMILISEPGVAFTQKTKQKLPQKTKKR